MYSMLNVTPIMRNEIKRLQRSAYTFFSSPHRLHVNAHRLTTYFDHLKGSFQRVTDEWESLCQALDWNVQKKYKKGPGLKWPASLEAQIV